MSIDDRFTEEEISYLLQLLRSDSITPDDIEQQLLNIQLNPNQTTIQRITMVDDPDSNLMYEIREGISPNAYGGLEETNELVINAAILSDGSPMNPFGLTRCQTCGGHVREENITRCLCGRTCCIRCVRFSRRGHVYCSRFHRFLGFLGFNLR